MMKSSSGGKIPFLSLIGRKGGNLSTNSLNTSRYHLTKVKGKVRPIGVGEVIRWMMGKCVMSATKQDVIDTEARQKWQEAAVDVMRRIFDADDTDAVLLIDASNAFNSLNRAAALHNISVLCPSIATYAINNYRRHARLFS